MLRLLIVFIAFVIGTAARADAACSGSGTTWTCPAGSSMTDIGSAYSSGTDPVDITLAEGSYTWATGSITLSNSKGIYLHCATALACDVDAGVNYMIYMDTLSGVNTKTYRFSGLDITQASTAYLAWIYSSGSPPTNTVMQNFRFDHNRVTLTSGATDWVAIKTGGGGKPGRIYGLIDNNTFQGAKNFTIAHLSGSGIDTTVNFHPESAGLRATVNNLFIEDNYISFDALTNAGLGCIDMVSAAAVVVRNNYSRNCLWTSHGVVHTGGAYNFEFYRNVVELDAGASPFEHGGRAFHHQGSGEITLWGNRFLAVPAYSGNFFELTHYRSGTGGEGTDPAGGEAGYDTLAQGKIYGRCTGSTTTPYAPDGNAVSPGNGYPCWMQPGRAPAASGAGTLSPVYVWDNQKPDGSLANLYVNPQWVVSVPPDASTHVVEERDWYESKTTDSSTFNGTVGVGFGVLASRPATCTTNGSESGGGVAYFGTDQGSWNTESSAVHTAHTAWGTTHTSGADGLLYRCSATNTWTLHYTPYDYPHPLRSGDVDPPAAGGPIRLRRP